VCATNRDLQALVDEGRFRGDLFARIQGFSLRLPLLRERKEDLYRLVRHFLGRLGRPELGVTFPFMTGLCHYGFPYNVRELETIVKRAVATADGSELDARDLPESITESMKTYGQRARPSAARAPSAAPAPSPSQTPSAAELQALLERHRGNVSAIARELGKDRVQIHRWMRVHGLKPEKFRV
jgi:DNA-binding NtrC family response regulator